MIMSKAFCKPQPTFICMSKTVSFYALGVLVKMENCSASATIEFEL